MGAGGRKERVIGGWIQPPPPKRNLLSSAASILKSAKNMDEETRQAVTHAAGLLLSSARDGLLRVVLEQEAEKGE